MLLRGFLPTELSGWLPYHKDDTAQQKRAACNPVWLSITLQQVHA
jgi:hypothetical protein